jgi:hypothetical protein
MNSSAAAQEFDPLEQAGTPERVNYATGVLLQAEDFLDEQTYHRAQLAVALRHLVGFGTLAGLAVRAPKPEDNELELRVEPGIALDRFGRLIEVRIPYCIRLARWFAVQDPAVLNASSWTKPAPQVAAAVIADVFLSARACGRGKTPSFASGPFDALDAVVPARLSEEPELTIIPRLEDKSSGTAEPQTIVEPENVWPGANASAENKLKAVLGSWNWGFAADPDNELKPLAEHVGKMNLSSVLLARLLIPVKAVGDAPQDQRPDLDLTKRVIVKNGIRPFIFLPGKWVGKTADGHAFSSLEENEL